MPSCSHKHRYDNRRDADESASLLTRISSLGERVGKDKKRRKTRRPRPLRAYKCPLCKGWHLTSRKPKEKRGD